VTTSSDDAPPAPGPYLQTVSGRWVNPFDPDPAQLDAGDIARALANQCRFGGHSRVFYFKASVPEVKRVDRALLATERRAFSAEVWHWPELDEVEPLDLELSAWSPDEAADEFAKRYAELEAMRLL
jgi:hypothetical protein